MSRLFKSLPVLSIRSTRPILLFLPKPLTTKALQKHNDSVFPSVSASTSSAETVTNAAIPPNPLLPVKETLEWVSRTGFCGELTLNDVGKRVRLCGWVALHRVHGGLTFLNLRDHTGIVQVATLPDEFPDAHSAVNDLRLEYVVAVEGVVRSRPSASINKNMITGQIEVAAEHVQVLSAVRLKLPFLVTTADEAKDLAKEEIRLRYRCLDLRRQQMSLNILLRHKVVKLMRRYLEDVHGFVEVD